jgi:hypothetical protein
LNEAGPAVVDLIYLPLGEGRWLAPFKTVFTRDWKFLDFFEDDYPPKKTSGPLS